MRCWSMVSAMILLLSAFQAFTVSLKLSEINAVTRSFSKSLFSSSDMVIDTVTKWFASAARMFKNLWVKRRSSTGLLRRYLNAYLHMSARDASEMRSVDTQSKDGVRQSCSDPSRLVGRKRGQNS